MTKVATYKKLFQFFLQGLLVIGPFAITIWAIAAAFNFVDGILPNIVHSIMPGIMEDGQGNIRRIPGLGFLVVVCVVVIVGYISGSFLFGKIEDGLGKLLQKTPAVNFIYTTLKDFFEAFAGDKKKFTNNVLASIDDKDVWRAGFITREDMADFGLHDYVAVYIPMAYSVAGNVYLVPTNRIRKMPNISASETMKFAVSGGVSSLDD
jgi:uncharacterized membrane protein